MPEFVVESVPVSDEAMAVVLGCEPGGVAAELVAAELAAMDARRAAQPAWLREALDWHDRAMGRALMHGDAST